MDCGHQTLIPLLSFITYQVDYGWEATGHTNGDIERQMKIIAPKIIAFIIEYLIYFNNHSLFLKI